MAFRFSITSSRFIQAMSVDSQRVPFQELMPEPLFDRHGKEYPQPVPKMKLGGGEVSRVNGYLSTHSWIKIYVAVVVCSSGSLSRAVPVPCPTNSRYGCINHCWWFVGRDGRFNDVYGRLEAWFDAFR